MKQLRIAVLLLLLTAARPAWGGEKTRAFPFTRDEAGKVPAGWQVAQTHAGEGTAWKVVADETAPAKTGYVLAQVGSAPNKVFNLCVASATSYRDVEITVAFKAVAGEKDQGGGVVWRYRDADNYYVARMNPLEDNYRVYKVVGGERKQLGTKEGLKIPVGQWHRLKVRQVGEHIECFLDGKKLLDVRDGTFRAAGRVGLWTKADARTRFDAFVVRPGMGTK